MCIRDRRHHALNDLVARAFASAGIPATKDPHGLTRSDGLTLVHWQRGKTLSWDVTVICPLADSYVELAAQETDSAIELADTRKLAKYSALWAQYDFQPVAVETLGPLNESACEFLNNLG